MFCCRRKKARKDHASTDSKPTLGEKVKAATVNAVFALLAHTASGFDRVLAGVKITAVNAGSVTCELTVHKGVENPFGALHGGATCTLVDIVGTMALMTLSPTNPGVSVDLNTSFVAAAKEGDELRIEGKYDYASAVLFPCHQLTFPTSLTKFCDIVVRRVLKCGSRLGFTQVDIFRKRDGALIATGRHTKAFT